MNAHPHLHHKALQFKSLTFILVIFVLLVALAQFCSFALIQNYVTAFYGAQPEDISMAVLAMYAGIIVMLPLHFRLLRYFVMRKYLFVALSLGILTSFGSFLTHDIVIFIILRFFQGASSAICAGSMLVIIFSMLPEEKRTVTGSAIFFGCILVTSVLIGVVTSWITVTMDWNYIYYVLIALQLLALFICLIIFQRKMYLKVYPLYQIDWHGTFYFVIFTISLSYVLIYGPKLYWFEDVSIQIFSAVIVLSLLIFLYRQKSLKRPLIDLSVFKYKKFLVGLFLLMLFYGIKDTINLVYGYAGGILGWSATDIVYLGFFNIAGAAIGITLSALLILKNKSNLILLLVSGFLLMVFYNLWMFFSLTPNLSFNDLILPVFIQGLSSGVIFLSVIIFTLSVLLPSAGWSGIIVCAYARFIASLNSVAGFYTLQNYYVQFFKQNFVGHLTSDNGNFEAVSLQYKKLFLAKGYTSEQSSILATALINKAVGIQSQLLTNKSIFLIGAAVMFLALVIFLIYVIAVKVAAIKKQKQFTALSLK